MRFRTALVVFAAIIALAGAVAFMPATGTPVCQTVLLQENSGNGPNYPMHVCNSGGPVFENPGIGKRWVLIIDGGALPEHSTRQVTVVAIAETVQR